jgi:hypothetical protein
MDKILIGIASAALGFLSGLLTPWIRWEIDKKRTKRIKREQLLERLRRTICADDFNALSFLQSTEYSELRTHLPDEIAHSLESRYKIISLSSSRPNTMQNELLDQVAQLEREWGLI